MITYRRYNEDPDGGFFFRCYFHGFFVQWVYRPVWKKYSFTLRFRSFYFIDYSEH